MLLHRRSEARAGIFLSALVPRLTIQAREQEVRDLLTPGPRLRSRVRIDAVQQVGREADSYRNSCS